MAVLVLACSTRIYYHFAVRNRNFVALISDLLLVISWALGAPGPHLPAFSTSRMYGCLSLSHIPQP